jgi:pimeloyl-ACP methyl ester carboxylesterase
VKSEISFMPYLDLPDCRLFYTIDDHTDPWSRAESVLFVHGFTENTEAWRAWVPHFSRRYRVIRFDQRGFGQSSPVTSDYPLTTELYVGDLARVIRQLAAGTDPDGTARVALDFIARHSAQSSLRRGRTSTPPASTFR